MESLHKSANVLKVSTIRDYFLIYLAFAFSTTSFFFGDRFKMAGFVLMTVFLYINQKNRLRFNRNLIYVVIYLVIIFIAQSVIYGKTNLQAFLFILLTYIFLPFLLLSLTKKTFIAAYINIVFLFSITSMILWGASNLFPSFYEYTSTIPVKYNTDLIAGNNRMFIIYAYEEAKVFDLIRNPGPTWEPGAWAIYLTIALLLNYAKKKTVFNLKNVFFIANIITTFSTTAYLGLGILIIYFLLFSKNVNFFGKAIFLPVFLFVFFRLYNDTEFMKQKIETNIESAKERDIREETSGRFFSLRKAALSFLRHPITGRGLVNISAAKEGEDESTGYGIIDLGVRFGILGLIFYLIVLFKSISMLMQNQGIKRISFIIVAYLVLILNFLSQGVYFFPIPLMIFFVFLTKDSVMHLRNRNIGLATNQDFYRRQLIR